METAMDEKTFLNFYKNTMLCCSNNLQRFVCSLLEKEHKITFDDQMTIEDTPNTMLFESKKDFKAIITKTAKNKDFMGFYEEFEFKKLYKYSVPFFFEKANGTVLKDLLSEKNICFFDANNYHPKYIIDRSLKEALPLAWGNERKLFIKFTLQKTYMRQDTYEPIDYRYPIVIYIDSENDFLEIRYDSMRAGEPVDNEAYAKIVKNCITWLQQNLIPDLYVCDHATVIKNINESQNDTVKMYKQMMELSSGGAAELTAAESADYVLPFIGEIRELIDENEDMFNNAEDIKQLLLQYVNEKEATASYPYIYVKWVKPVESQSYIVKITFDYFYTKYTLLQHITGNCKDLEMGRMNDAIEYLCKSSSFVKGEKI